jgi:Spy/CpxP family protein refolding chaperone
MLMVCHPPASTPDALEFDTVFPVLRVSAVRAGVQRLCATVMESSLLRGPILATLLLMPVSASAQAPYAGMQTRPVKAISEQQMADLKAGRGMGLALAAELNGYPGPSHVLELADKLELSADQRTNVQRLFDQMRAEAVPLGSKLIEQEAELDQQFAGDTVTPESLKASTAAVALTQGALRETHLKYHLSTAAILTQNQMQRYAELRGYGNDSPMRRHHN